MYGFFLTEKRGVRDNCTSTRKNNYAFVNLKVRIEICHCRYISMLINQVIFGGFSCQCQNYFLLIVSYPTDKLQNVYFPDTIRCYMKYF